MWCKILFFSTKIVHKVVFYQNNKWLPAHRELNLKKYRRHQPSPLENMPCWHEDVMCNSCIFLSSNEKRSITLIINRAVLEGVKFEWRKSCWNFSPLFVFLVHNHVSTKRLEKGNVEEENSQRGKYLSSHCQLPKAAFVFCLLKVCVRRRYMQLHAMSDLVLQQPTCRLRQSAWVCLFWNWLKWGAEEAQWGGGKQSTYLSTASLVSPNENLIIQGLQQEEQVEQVLFILSLHTVHGIALNTNSHTKEWIEASLDALSGFCSS